MKISQKLAAAEAEGRVTWSFEYFPPKTDNALLNLYDRIERMSQLGPSFIDITWGAGGTTSNLTTAFVKTAHETLGLETCMHLTCTNMPREKVDLALKEASKSGCRNILALRGDPPRGHCEWKVTEGGFEHAIDLIKHIRKGYTDQFDIAVAGFPEGHPDSKLTRVQETQYLKEKIDAGASFIVTQMFYDADTFISWVKEVRAAGITVPIVPGIMPIQGWAGFERTTSMCSTRVPQSFLDDLEPVKNNDEKVREIGTRLVADMCRKILNADVGIKNLHFYTMNLEKGTKMILDHLGLTPSRDVTNPLPWRLSLSSKRRSESTRPIFWANRPASYISRTDNWDEFPNGRWGSTDSPAFGELDGYGVSLKPDTANALVGWGSPTSVEDLAQLFSGYCRGHVKHLPWSDKELAGETSKITDCLIDINERGFLTINSQPAVDGLPSSDPTHGWGPKGGYVYQKAYVEFFCSPELLDQLAVHVRKDPNATYYAVNKNGDLRTNTMSEGPNAVTWGVFPGKEIIQPTIVEAISFMAWKDEAFELGFKWADVYDVDRNNDVDSRNQSSPFIRTIMNTWFLVNIVNNDFKCTDPKHCFGKYFDWAPNLINTAVSTVTTTAPDTCPSTPVTPDMTTPATPQNNYSPASFIKKLTQGFSNLTDLNAQNAQETLSQ